jgi:hypothetical protein
MSLTGAQRQASWRIRRARRAAVLEAEVSRLAAENGSLRAENAGLADECERLAALACRHPAGAVDGGHCHACGQDVG